MSAYNDAIYEGVEWVVNQYIFMEEDMSYCAHLAAEKITETFPDRHFYNSIWLEDLIRLHALMFFDKWFDAACLRKRSRKQC